MDRTGIEAAAVKAAAIELFNDEVKFHHPLKSAWGDFRTFYLTGPSIDWSVLDDHPERFDDQILRVTFLPDRASLAVLEAYQGFFTREPKIVISYEHPEFPTNLIKVMNEIVSIHYLLQDASKEEARRQEELFFEERG